MLLTVDVGNTNIVFTVFGGEKHDEIIFESRINTDGARMSDQYAIMLMDIFKLHSADKSEVKGAIISSVVPTVTLQLKSAIEKLCGINVMIIGPGVKTGLNIRIDDPSSLGGDLACAAVAAKKKYPLPCIIMDLGTVTKVLALDKAGALLGGILYPGVKTGLESLAESTAALPLVSIDKSDKVIASNTVECMRSGIIHGMAAMLDGMVRRFEKELGECSIVATGGHCPDILPYCEREVILNPHLVSEGLKIIYNKNKK